MKKLFFVLALVAVYGVSLAMSSAMVITVDNLKASIVAVDEKTDKADKEKEAKAATTETKAKGEGCGSAKSAGCGDKAKSADCGDKAKAACAEKKEGTK